MRTLALLGFALVTAFASPPEILSRSDAARNGGYFPVLIRARGGDLMSVLRGGGAHIGRAGRLDVIHSRDGGKTWSVPRTVADGPEDDRNPAFGELRDGTLLLAYCILSGYEPDGAKLVADRTKRIFDGAYVMRSRDGGKTWSKAERSAAIHEFAGGQAYVSPFGRIIQLRDGTVLMPVYFDFFNDERRNQSFVFRSSDGGVTWKEPALIGEHYNETSIAELADGTVLAALRSEKEGAVAVSRSNDGGRTWSKPEPVTGPRQHPADLTVLKDGRVLLTYGERNAPYGIHALLSKDRGKSWNTGERIVIASDLANSDSGYPSSVQLSDGSIATIFYRVDDLKNAPASARAESVVWRLPR